MKVIQICGTNGTGKTTLVKGLLTTGNFLRMELPIDGEVKEWWYDGQVAVIGRYAQNNCCGVDAGKYSGEQLLKVIDTILDVYEPSTVVFEDMRFGGSYTFKRKAWDVAKKYGGSYYSVVLVASLATVSKRVIERTGNPNVDFDRMRKKARHVIKSSQKMQADGAKVLYIDSERLDKMATLGALRAIIHE